MNKQKLGLTIFWIGIIYLLISAGLGGWGEPSNYTKLSSIIGSPAFFLWAFSVPIGSILSSIGILLYVQAKGSKIALFGIGMALVVFLNILLRGFLIARDAHFHELFGMGGGLILIMYSGLIWFWAKKRNTFKSEAKTVADLELVGYGFFLIAAWDLCGAFSVLFNESMSSSFTPRSPLNIMIYLVLGWLFILISNYKAAQIDK